MLRKLMPFLLLVPLAARAEWRGQDDEHWAGDDQYSSEPWDGEDARGDGYGAQQQYENPPPPPDDDYGTDRYATAPAPVDDYVGPSMADFRSGLRPYGRWIRTPDYGWVWRPRHVGDRWQPYWDGRWVWTTAGWTWVSDEPWGWATYHYGRWAIIDGVGWVWLPGRVWGPAWVAWRWGGGYAGWCPLGPRGAVYVQPRTWVFVETPYFMTPVRHHAVPVGVVATVWSRAQPMPIVHPSPRAGPPPRVVEQHTRIPVRAVPIVEADSRSATRPLSSGVLPVWRPRTVPYSRPVAPAPSGPPARAQPGNPGVARGWREQLPTAQQPRPSAPPAQQSRPVAPAAQPVRPSAPAVRPSGARSSPAPRVERDERGSSGRPHAQPLNGAREPERQ